jgi:hypothetical protein
VTSCVSQAGVNHFLRNLSERLNLSQEEGEKWIVNLIRETRMGADAKIDLEKVRIYKLLPYPGRIYLPPSIRLHLLFYLPSVSSTQLTNHLPTERDRDQPPTTARVPDRHREDTTARRADAGARRRDRATRRPRRATAAAAARKARVGGEDGGGGWKLDGRAPVMMGEGREVWIKVRFASFPVFASGLFSPFRFFCIAFYLAFSSPCTFVSRFSSPAALHGQVYMGRVDMTFRQGTEER